MYIHTLMTSYMTIAIYIYIYIYISKQEASAQLRGFIARGESHDILAIFYPPLK